MSWISFHVDMDRCARALERIADAFDRISPPPLPESDPPSQSSSHSRDEPPLFYMAESPEQYQERMSAQAALAVSLGVAPWSPAFQRAVDDMRADMIKQGNNEQEADDLIRRAFQAAKSEANERTYTPSAEARARKRETIA